MSCISIAKNANKTNALYRIFLHEFSKLSMSSSSRKCPCQSARDCPRFTLQASFSTFEERDAFARRFEAVCALLQPVGAPGLDNHGIFCALLDVVERNARQDNFPGDERVETRSYLRNNGKKNSQVCI